MIKKILKRNKFRDQNYKKLKKYINDNNSFKCRYKFDNRSHDEEYLCIVLAGYKPFLMCDVFDRIKLFKKDKMDICIITSGIYSNRIADVCKDNGWSYLSTKENNVSLVQNVAIKLHPAAKYIFKLDEDVFITKNYFERMIEAFRHAEISEFFPGVIAPLLNVNGYSYVRILEKLDIKEKYSSIFEKVKYAAGPDRLLENCYQAAEFMWGSTGDVPQIDILNEQLWNSVHRELPCPIRFSIGAILFERNLWESMGHFKVNRKTNAMGADEAQLCEFCILQSRPIMVSENIVVGHFSFGPQTNEMKEFYKAHNDLFKIHIV